jgi:adenylate cyclase
MYETKQTPQLGGVEVNNTCFFSDIASFSSFSEKMTAPELVILLNEYLEEMTNILLENGGTLDKYIGDAILGIFGSPIKLDDHEYRGVLSICQMNKKLEELRKKWKSEGDKWPEVVHNMRHRIGLNTGQIVAGNMGSSVRMSYTMMGDAVNTTARLESGAKQYGIESQVGEKIYEATKDKFTYRHLDHVRVKGKIEPVKTFELISLIGEEPHFYKDLILLWDEAINLYKSQKWDQAIKVFKKCNKVEEKYIGRPTNPSLFFIERCNEFKANPPEKDWDGIYTLKSK